MEYQKSIKNLEKQVWFKLTKEDHHRLQLKCYGMERSVAYVLRKLVEDFIKQ